MASGCLDSGGGSTNQNNDSESRSTSGNNGWSPIITDSEPKIVPGDEAVLTVEATNVAGVTLSLPDTDVVTIDANDHDWSPPPDTTLDSYPQIWFWSSQSTVEGKFPVTATEDADPGEYSYEVTVYADDDSDAESVTEEFTIAVTKN